jgi:hypothetical protein
MPRTQWLGRDGLSGNILDVGGGTDDATHDQDRVAGTFAALLGAGSATEAIAQQAACRRGCWRRKSAAVARDADGSGVRPGPDRETARNASWPARSANAGHVAARQKRLEQEGGGAARTNHGDYVEQVYRPLMRHSKYLLKSHYQHPLTVESNHPADSAAPGAVR